MITQPILSQNLTSRLDNLSNTLNLLSSPDTEVTTLNDRLTGKTFSINGVTVALKCPTIERANICLELLHDDADGQWQDSWFFTCKADAFLWVLPEGKHLWVKRKYLQHYEYTETVDVPRTNHSQATRNRLARQGAPCNVVTKWVDILDVVANTCALCYNVNEYNAATLDSWLKEYFYNAYQQPAD